MLLYIYTSYFYVPCISNLLLWQKLHQPNRCAKQIGDGFYPVEKQESGSHQLIYNQVVWLPSLAGHPCCFTIQGNPNLSGSRCRTSRRHRKRCHVWCIYMCQGVEGSCIKTGLLRWTFRHLIDTPFSIRLQWINASATIQRYVRNICFAVLTRKIMSNMCRTI